MSPGVPSQPRQHSETPFKKKKKIEKSQNQKESSGTKGTKKYNDCVLDTAEENIPLKAEKRGNSNRQVSHATADEMCKRRAGQKQ